MCSVINQWPKHLKSLLTSCKDKESIAKIHALFIQTGLLINGKSNAQLIKAYACYEGLHLARKLFDELPHRGVDVYNSMTVAYSRQNCPEEVLKLHRLMRVSHGVKPDSSSFTVALKACASLADLRAGEDIWFDAVGHGYEFDDFVGTSVLNLYVKCGNLDYAVKVFDKMRTRDIVCYTTMMNGFVDCERALEAVGFYRRMRREGVKPDGVVTLGLVRACSSLGDLRSGLSIHTNLVRRYWPMDVSLQTSLVDMYAKAGKLEFAKRIFRKMSLKSDVSWGALICGYTRNELPWKALDLLVEMQSLGFEPGTTSLVSAILACSQIGSLKSGRSVHGYIVRRLNLDRDHVLGTATIEMYSKCGSLSHARTLFDRTHTKDSIFWNAMISSYAVHGKGREALSLFLDMTRTSTRPDETTFASLLSACSHSGLVEEGQRWFSIMQSDYKIQAREKHYLCLVDLLARSGRVKEAYELINSMKSEPGLSIWVALLSGCHNHGESKIGETAVKKILELDPKDLGVHSLIANFYAKEGKWTEAARLRNAMKRTGTKKIPGQSALEVNGTVHSFVMEDNNHDRCVEIVRFLKKLDRHIRMVGCVIDSELV